jgi:hypothetical protein
MKNQKLADLVQGIEGLLSKGRCPLTDEDEVLLRSCISELKGLQNKPDWIGTMEKVTKWLLLLLEVHDKFKEFL